MILCEIDQIILQDFYLVETKSESSLRAENRTNAASDFSPGNFDCISAVEELERKKLKGKRDYN
jgi:hypothetical protein